MQQKIKQDIAIGQNIRRIRLSQGIGQTEFVNKLQLIGCDITREALVKIERCTQHIQATQLIAMHKVLGVPLEDFFSVTCTKES